MKKIVIISLLFVFVFFSLSFTSAVDFNENDTLANNLMYSQNQCNSTYSNEEYDYIPEKYNSLNYDYEDYDDYSQYEKYWMDNVTNYTKENNDYNDVILKNNNYEYNDTLIFSFNSNYTNFNNSILNNKSFHINVSEENTIKLQNMTDCDYVSNISTSISNQINFKTNTIVNYTVSNQELLENVNIIKSYVDTYHEFPDIIINNNTISQSNLLYMLCSFVLNETTFNFQEFPTVKPYIITDCYNTSMNKTQYMNFANNILNFYSNYGRPPANVLSDFGRITFDDTLYFYLNIVNYYGMYDEFPESQLIQEYLNIYDATVNNFEELKNLLTMNTLDYNFMIITINNNFPWNELIIVNSSIKRIYIQYNSTNPIQSYSNLLYIVPDHDLVFVNLYVIQNMPSGGSLFFNWGQLSIINSTFQGISGYNSWMIYNEANLTVYNSNFIGNEYFYVGAIANEGSSNIQNCRFINIHDMEGIIYNNYATMNIFNSSFENNVIHTSIFHNNQSNLIINNCNIFNNSESYSNNHYSNFIYSIGGNTTLFNNKIFSNKMSGDYFIYNNGTLIMRNNIISNQTSNNTILINSIVGIVSLVNNTFNNISNLCSTAILVNQNDSKAFIVINKFIFSYF